MVTVKGQNGTIGQHIASFTRIPGQASALVIVQFIHAESVVHAGIVFALVDFSGAIFAGESWRTGTDEIVDGVMTSTSIGTGIDSTFVDVLLTMRTGESGQAVTLVVADEVNAGAAVLARVHCTIINVLFAMFSTEPLGTHTFVLIFVFGIDGASSSVLARIAHLALVNFDVTVDTGVAGLAPTLVTGWSVNAVGTVLARIVGALLGC